MVAIGLVLFVLAVLLALGIALPNDGPVDAQAFGVDLSNVSVGGLFVVGLVTGAVLTVGLGLVLAGLARRRTKSKAVKRQVSSARSDAESLADENARLQERLEQEKTAGPRGTTTAPGATDSGDAKHGTGDRAV